MEDAGRDFIPRAYARGIAGEVLNGLPDTAHGIIEAYGFKESTPPEFDIYNLLENHQDASDINQPDTISTPEHPLTELFGAGAAQIILCKFALTIELERQGQIVTDEEAEREFGWEEYVDMPEKIYLGLLDLYNLTNEIASFSERFDWLARDFSGDVTPQLIAHEFNNRLNLKRERALSSRDVISTIEKVEDGWESIDERTLMLIEQLQQFEALNTALGPVIILEADQKPILGPLHKLYQDSNLMGLLPPLEADQNVPEEVVKLIDKSFECTTKPSEATSGIDPKLSFAEIFTEINKIYPEAHSGGGFSYKRIEEHQKINIIGKICEICLKLPNNQLETLAAWLDFINATMGLSRDMADRLPLDREGFMELAIVYAKTHTQVMAAEKVEGVLFAELVSTAKNIIAEKFSDKPNHMITAAYVARAALNPGTNTDDKAKELDKINFEITKNKKPWNLQDLEELIQDILE